VKILTKKDESIYYHYGGKGHLSCSILQIMRRT